MRTLGESQWPEWLRYTLTALAGVGAAVVTMTLSFADVRSTAAGADAVTKDHEVRIRADHDAITGLKGDVGWIRAALASGVDPDTGKPIPHR